MRATRRRWELGLLRWLEYATVPAFAGAAFWLLALGVVTWLPALAAAARALRGWREEGDTNVFTATLRAFPRYARRLLPLSILSTVAAVLLAVNVLFLAQRPGPVAGPLLWGQLGIGAVCVVFHVHLVVAAARRPDDTAGAWCRAALRGFGSPGASLAVLGAAVAATLLTVVVPLGPLLYGPTVPVLLGLYLASPPATHLPTEGSPATR